MTIEDYMAGIEQGRRIVVANIMEQQDALEAEYQRRRPSYGFPNEDEGDRYCRVDVILDFIDKINLPVQGAQRMSAINDVMKSMFPELKVEYEAMKWGRALHGQSQDMHFEDGTTGKLNLNMGKHEDTFFYTLGQVGKTMEREK